MKKKKEVTIEEKLEQALVPVEERPYAVPSNWVWVRLGEIIPPKTGKKDANYGDESGTYSFFTCAFEPIKSPDYSFEGKAILLPGNGANVGHVLFYNGKFEAYQRTYILQSEKLYLEYIFYHLQFNWKIHNENKQFGSATNYIKLGNFQSYLFPLPPLAEQERIVNHIESLFAKLDNAQELLERALESFDTRKSALLHQAFTGELTKKWREENGVSFESWEEKKAKEVCELITKGETPTKHISKNGDIPFLKVYNIRNNLLDFEYDSAFIPQSIHDNKMKRSKIFPKDIIMNIVGPPLQKVAIIPDCYSEWNINQAIAFFRVKKDLYYKYLYYCLLWEESLKDIFADLRGVVGQSNISLEQCRNIPINLPTLPEQKEIVRILDSAFEKENKAKEKIEQSLKHIEHMKKAILARAFRGELGTNNENDGNALELLKEVLG